MALADLKVGPVRYNAPMTQVVLVGLVCFCTVGMFSAVSNLGAGGTTDIALTDLTNGVLYGFFAVTGLIAGGICNVLGPRLTLFIGAWGYGLYVGALWCHQKTQNRGFLVASGAILGICAAMLWSAQGSIMMSYPPDWLVAVENDKGKAFGIFWAIFQSGSLVGAAIALGITAQSTLPSVAIGTYLAFIIIICIGIALTWAILPAHLIVRSDETVVKVDKKSSVGTELHGLIKTCTDWRMILLIPMFFCSNWFYAYQGALNTFYFNGRTRALNAFLEGLGAIIGALVIGNCCLDIQWIGNRRRRGFAGLAVVTLLMTATWVGALVWQTEFTRSTEKPNMDWKDSGYGGRGFLFFAFYFSDATFQALAYWIMAALSNDPFTLARFAGFYKALQSAGAAGSFGMDAVATPFLNELLASWLMMVLSLPLAGIVIWTIKDTNYEVEEVVHVADLDHAPGALPAVRLSHDDAKKNAAAGFEGDKKDEVRYA